MQSYQYCVLSITYLSELASQDCASWTRLPAGQTHLLGPSAWTGFVLGWSGGWARWSSGHPRGRWGRSQWPPWCAGGSWGPGSRPGARSTPSFRPRRYSWCTCPSGSDSGAPGWKEQTFARLYRYKLKWRKKYEKSLKWQKHISCVKLIEFDSVGLSL